MRIHFSPRDLNEAALDLFDRTGLQIWLQVEPRDAPVGELGRRIVGAVPNAAGLFWVAFTILDVFPPQ